MTERVDHIVQTLIDIGQQRGKTPAQVAIAWILAREGVTAPIVGPDFPEQLEEVFGALEVELTAEEQEALDGVSAFEKPWKYA